jgi:hypothetical protein
MRVAGLGRSVLRPYEITLNPGGRRDEFGLRD